MLKIDNVFAGYRLERDVLRGVSLALERGMHVILGPNGSGKTTLLRVACGALRPRAGVVTVHGMDPWQVPSVKRRVAYVGHKLAVEHGLFVRDAMVFWARVIGMERGCIESRVQEVSEMFGIRELLLEPIDGLSRGQAQVVSVARSVMGQPDLLLLDEPGTGLDLLRAGRVRLVLETLIENGTAILCSTHHVEEAAELADYLGVMIEGRLMAHVPLSECVVELDKLAHGQMGSPYVQEVVHHLTRLRRRNDES